MRHRYVNSAIDKIILILRYDDASVLTPNSCLAIVWVTLQCFWCVSFDEDQAMNLFKLGRIGLVVLFLAGIASAQTPQAVRGADERFKADILVVVAHPDDEGGATPYLARAIYDLHKRVAVVYATRGGSGGNDYSREHGPALADIREMEAREACAKLGITNVWFLDGKDTASQNVLNSLANWGHGSNLEKLVGIFRLTRPEVVITWLPGIFIGENHGDHQAAGVLATEAFDLSGDPVWFPAQVAGATKRLESYLENLTPWQAKKIYYFSDAKNDKQFAGKGPSYSIKEISPSQKKPYWRLALDAAAPHKTQFPKEIVQITKLSDEQVEKMVTDPNTGWWTDPETLIFGKAINSNQAADDVFANLQGETVRCLENYVKSQSPVGQPTVELGGPWKFYEAFRKAHCLETLPAASPAEIAVKAGTTLSVPLVVSHDPTKTLEVSMEVNSLPEGWKVTSGTGRFILPAEVSTAVRVDLQTPERSSAELKTVQPQDVHVKVEVEGKTIGEIVLRVLLGTSGLPQ
jgi:LmbE family N-acetylglucosaminyl deacetylase